MKLLAKKVTILKTLAVCILGAFLRYEGGPLPTMPSCLAANLPEGELAVLLCHSKKYNYKLVKTDSEIKIETSLNI